MNELLSKKNCKKEKGNKKGSEKGQKKKKWSNLNYRPMLANWMQIAMCK